MGDMEDTRGGYIFEAFQRGEKIGRVAFRKPSQHLLDGFPGEPVDQVDGTFSIFSQKELDDLIKHLSSLRKSLPKNRL